MEKTGIALIGCGYWGKNYLKTLRDMGDVDLRWICDVKNLPENHIFPEERTTYNYEKVLEDRRVKGLIISTPINTHYELAKKALYSGKDVLLEKPITNNSEEALDLIKCSRKNNQILIPGHIFAHNPSVQKLEEIIERGEIGDILSMRANRLSLGPIRTEENAMWDLMPHDISMFLRFKFEKPISAYAFGSATLKRAGIKDEVTLGLRYPDETLGTCSVSWLYPKKMREIIIVGTKKMAAFDDVSMNKLEIYDSGVKEADNIDPFDYARTARQGDIYIPKITGKSPLELQCKDFVNCIKTRQDGRVKPLEGYQVVRILEAGEESLDKRIEIRLNDLKETE